MPIAAAESRLRVLVISHNCVGESNRRRIEAIAAMPGVDVALLTPPWWFEEGRRIDVGTEAEGTLQYRWQVGRTVATNNGTRHLYRDTLFALVRSFRPDVIDVHEEPFSFAALQALLARNVLARRAALLFCSYVNVDVRWRWPYRLAERAVLAGADAAYAPNADVPGVLRRKGFARRVDVIPSGVDVARFAGAAPADLAAQLDGAPRPYVGFLGRVEPVKGLEYLVEAAARLRAAGTIVVAGSGPEEDRLHRLVQSHGLRERVRFLPGMPFAKVPGFIRGLDAVVLPSVTIPPLFKEQFGRVLTEAMAAGVATLGSTSGAIPDVIGDAGLVVPERDSAALAGALERIMRDPALRADLAVRGRARVDQYYAWPVVAGQAVRLYQDAVRLRRGSMGASWEAAEAGHNPPGRQDVEVSV